MFMIFSNFIRTSSSVLVSLSPISYRCLHQCVVTDDKSVAYWKNNLEKFYQWFVGFSEAESCFKIKAKNRNDKLHSFYFEFEIHLHIDEIELLKLIRDILGIGIVYAREKSNSCSYIVGNEEGIRILMDIFDRYTFNGIKLLDYNDFRAAFLLYFDRFGTLTKDLITKILSLKAGMNKGRVNFSMPSDHVVNITKY